MATTTPNIGLTLPIGTENVSRQIINTNNTKIDTAIGTLNSNLPKYAITSTTSGTLNANTDNTITIETPGSYNEILAIVPIGYTPATSWNTRLQFTNVSSLVNHTIGARTIGSDSQKYTIRCLVVYK